MRVAILAPIQTSYFARIVTHLAAKLPDVTVVGVVVRTPWTWQRIRSEFRRDGARLVRKAYRKLVLKESDFDASSSDHLLALAKEVNLPGSSLAEQCRLAGIPGWTAADHNMPTALDFLRSVQPDAIAFTGGGLLRKPLLEIPKLGVINCHMGILPRYRGMDVVEYPVAEDRLAEEGIGLTLHYMDAGLDTGPILLRRPIALRRGDRFTTLRQRMERNMAELMIEGLAGLASGSITPEPQRVEDGRQYFVMHPRIEAMAEEKLKRAVETLP